MLNRRLLMAQAGAMPPGGIVTDGLILWLDGTNKGKNDGFWTDRVNSIQFKINDSDVTENGVVFKRKPTSFLECQTDISGIMSDTATAEYVRNIENAGNNIAILSNPDINAINLFERYNANNRLTYIQMYANTVASAYETAHYFMTGEYTVSVSDLRCYTNLEAAKKAPFKILDVYGKNYTTIGMGYWKNKPDSYWQGIFYGLRLYNRVLTDAEILQNQQYDIDTYFGGVIPE